MLEDRKDAKQTPSNAFPNLNVIKQYPQSRQNPKLLVETSRQDK